ncbi:MAG: ABC transporter permease [bacterium]
MKNPTPFVEPLTLEYIRTEQIGSTLIMKLLGPFFISHSAAIDKSCQCDSKLEGISKVQFDFSELELYDSFLLIFLDELEAMILSRKIETEYINLNDTVRAFISVQRTAEENKIRKERLTVYKFIEIFGNGIVNKYKEMRQMIEFVGIIFKTMIKSILHPSLIRWKDFPNYFYTTGVNALPINVLIIILLGFITGWQGAIQLKQFGADQFLAPLVGFSIIRELSPIMVAIIVAGRSGSAFAAEIGTMKVSDELDSLDTMGFNKIAFLVMPRILALTIALPILVLICDLMGVVGGLIAGLATLNITIASYFYELSANLGMIDIMYGVVKAVVFGFMISIIGCFRGLQVTNNAESVGKNTTASVVSGIFIVIVIDALFVVLYDQLF